MYSSNSRMQNRGNIHRLHDYEHSSNNNNDNISPARDNTSVRRDQDDQQGIPPSLSRLLNSISTIIEKTASSMSPPRANNDNGSRPISRGDNSGNQSNNNNSNVNDQSQQNNDNYNNKNGNPNQNKSDNRIKRNRNNNRNNDKRQNAPYNYNIGREQKNSGNNQDNSRLLNDNSQYRGRIDGYSDHDNDSNAANDRYNRNRNGNNNGNNHYNQRSGNSNNANRNNRSDYNRNRDNGRYYYNNNNSDNYNNYNNGYNNGYNNQNWNYSNRCYDNSHCFSNDEQKRKAFGECLNVCGNKSQANFVRANFSRIKFTPDLKPILSSDGRFSLYAFYRSDEYHEIRRRLNLKATAIRKAIELKSWLQINVGPYRLFFNKENNTLVKYNVYSKYLSRLIQETEDLSIEQEIVNKRDGPTGPKSTQGTRFCSNREYSAFERKITSIDSVAKLYSEMKTPIAALDDINLSYSGPWRNVNRPEYKTQCYNLLRYVDNGIKFHIIFANKLALERYGNRFIGAINENPQNAVNDNNKNSSNSNINNRQNTNRIQSRNSSSSTKARTYSKAAGAKSSNYTKSKPPWVKNELI